jgi:hypothetical protein
MNLSQNELLDSIRAEKGIEVKKKYIKMEVEQPNINTQSLEQLKTVSDVE